MIRLTKRRRFITTATSLSLGFFGVQFLPENFRYLSIGCLSLLTLIGYIWSLREGLGINMTLVTLILPFMFTLGVGLFWFLLPASIFARVPIVVLYGLGMYALCLTSNIYTVAAIRTIALFRAAKGVGFVLSLLTFFLLFDTILSIRLPFVLLGLSVFAASFPLYIQGYWIIKLEKRPSTELLLMALVSSLVTSQVSLALFFWPVTIVVGSLFMTVTAYVLLGLGQADLEGRLFSQTIKEYLMLAMLVFFVMFLATKWGS